MVLRAFEEPGDWLQQPDLLSWVNPHHCFPPRRPYLALHPPAVRAVVCRAQQQQQSLASKAAAAAVSLPAFLAAHPAFALVSCLHRAPRGRVQLCSLPGALPTGAGSLEF